MKGIGVGMGGDKVNSMDNITNNKRGFNEKSLGNLKPIKKGEVRNPGGRPRKFDCLLTCIKAELAAKCALQPKLTKEQLIAGIVVDMACRGNENMIKLLFEYTVIKPAQAINMGGAEGGPVILKVVYETPCPNTQ
jgi:hypothetical protein